MSVVAPLPWIWPLWRFGRAPDTSWLRSMTPPPGPLLIDNCVTAATASVPVPGVALLICTRLPLISIAMLSAALLVTVNSPELAAKEDVTVNRMRCSSGSNPSRRETGSSPRETAIDFRIGIRRRLPRPTDWKNGLSHECAMFSCPLPKRSRPSRKVLDGRLAENKKTGVVNTRRLSTTSAYSSTKPPGKAELLFI